MCTSARGLRAIALPALLLGVALFALDSIYADQRMNARSEPVTAAQARLDVAKFTESGELIRPDNLDRWVFLGASLGMSYNETQLDPGSPGRFHVVLMEPNAYEHFKAHGDYADGSMLLLSFYATEQHVSIDRRGLVQGDLNDFEIHLIDHGKFADGRAFYPFGRESQKASAVPPGNPCTECHVSHGAFDGTFVQFYPAIRHRIAPALLEKSRSKGSH